MLRLGLPIALGGFFLDQATKWWVLNHVMNPPQVIPVTGFFNLVLGFNTGVSFGLFGQAPAWLLMAFTLAIVAGLLVWIHRSDSRLTASALGLVVGRSAICSTGCGRVRWRISWIFTLAAIIGPPSTLPTWRLSVGSGFCWWRAFWHEAKQRLHEQKSSPAIRNYRRKIPGTCNVAGFRSSATWQWLGRA